MRLSRINARTCELVSPITAAACLGVASMGRSFNCIGTVMSDRHSIPERFQRARSRTGYIWHDYATW